MWTARGVRGVIERLRGWMIRIPTIYYIIKLSQVDTVMCHKGDVNPCMKISMKVVTSQSILFSEGKIFVPRQM